MRRTSSGPLSTLWRRLPRAVAGSVAALAELSPLRAFVALVVTLGCGTSAAVAVASVGGAPAETAQQPVLSERPLSTASRDAQRPDVEEPAQTSEGGATAPSSPETARPQTPRTRVHKTPAAPGTSSATPSRRQQAPVTPSSGASTSSEPAEAGSDAPDTSSTPDGGSSSGSGDDSPPETVLAEWYPDGDDAVFSFRANEAALYECSLDGATYTPCESPASFSSVHPGWHTFAVRAKDAAGNVDPTPAEVRWHANAGSPPARDRP